MEIAMSRPAATGRYPAAAPIEAYGNGGFRFAGMSHRGSILCLPDGIEAWDVAGVDLLTPESLAPVLQRADAIELLLLGTGLEHRPPAAGASDAIRGAGIGFDVMSTGAAARTWNILLAEGRRVAAALIAVD
jgi:uncharacterized protein